jgi:hypothetical protein
MRVLKKGRLRNSSLSPFVLGLEILSSALHAHTEEQPQEKGRGSN